MSVMPAHKLAHVLETIKRLWLKRQAAAMDDVTFHMTWLRDWSDYAASNTVNADIPGEKPARYCIRAVLVKPERADRNRQSIAHVVDGLSTPMHIEFHGQAGCEPAQRWFSARGGWCRAIFWSPQLATLGTNYRAGAVMTSWVPAEAHGKCPKATASRSIA